MIVNASSLRDLFTGFNTSFNKGLKNTTSHWDKIAMRVPSTAASENYSWLTDMPGIREWLGERLINSLSAARYVVENREFELTISVRRNHIEDDKYGLYGPRIEQMGYETARHPDELVFGVLKDGTTKECYDRQYFFDTDHSGYDAAGEKITVSNLTAGAGPAWYLLDCSQPIKPLLFQERQPFVFESLTEGNSDHVFLRAEYLYGVRGRSNAGFGLWQLAHCSKAEFNETNFAAARLAMTGQKRRSGQPLGINSSHLVVPRALEAAARKLLHAQLINGGESNIWAEAAELIVSDFL